MQEECDFSGGVRGKHFKKMQEVHQTIIHKSDGSKVVKTTRLIILVPDIKEHFPDSEAVNNALRGLLETISDKQII